MRISLEDQQTEIIGTFRPFLVLALMIPFVLLGIQAVAKTTVVVPPKSVFIDEPEFGRDPFFPNSARREVKVTAVATNKPAQLAFPTDLLLKGLSGRRGRPLAIINNATFSVGETRSVKIRGKKVQVHCLEIKPGSVRVKVNGKVRDLFLRKNLLN